MKRLFPLVAALLLAISFQLGRGARADGEHKPSPWEYRVFLVDAREFHDKDDWKAMVEKNGGNEFHADADFKAYVLNHLAKEEGWELQQVIQPVKDKPEIVHFYLRRARS